MTSSDNTVAPSIATARPIGLLGGTFNPIHYGHLLPTAELMSELNIHDVRLIPCHRPPHKQTPKVDSNQRATMVQLACDFMNEQHHCALSVDLLELNRQTPSYTVDTLNQYRQQHPTSPLWFLMGLDSLLNFKTWHQWQQILTLCHLVVSVRPGYSLDGQNTNSDTNIKSEIDTVHDLLEARKTEQLSDLHHKLAGHIYFAAITEQNISSSEIRKQYHQGQDPSQLMPPNVAKHINQQRLYK